MSVPVQSQCLGARFRTWRHYASEMRKSPQRVGVFSPQASGRLLRSLLLVTSKTAVCLLRGLRK